MKAFRELIENGVATGELTGLDDVLADDVSFSSPVAFKPYEGRPIVAAILRGVSRVFTEFTYVWSAEEENRSALMFECKVGDVSVQGCDFITTNDAGQISNFVVMVRPLSAANAVAEAMAAQFPQIQAEAIEAMK